MVYRIVFRDGEYHIVEPTEIHIRGGFGSYSMAEQYVKNILDGHVVRGM